MKRSAVLLILLAACSSGGTTDPPADQFGTVRGRVLDVDDAALSGVAISLQRTGSTTRNTTTDGSGNFQVANLLVGAWTVTAEPPDGYEAQGSLTATAQVTANQIVDVPVFRMRETEVTPPPSQVAVSIGDNLFNPATATVAVGGTVTWTNNGAVAHNVTGGDFASTNLTPTQQFARTFPTAGTFNYSCTLHAGMSGTVVVQ